MLIDLDALTRLVDRHREEVLLSDLDDDILVEAMSMDGMMGEDDAREIVERIRDGL